jgi:hypothetical protein
MSDRSDYVGEWATIGGAPYLRRRYVGLNGSDWAAINEACASIRRFCAPHVVNELEPKSE